MICPDCNKEIGRFAAVGDEGGSMAYATCPRTGRKVVLATAPEPQKTAGRKAWKRPKSKRPEPISV